MPATAAEARVDVSIGAKLTVGLWPVGPWTIGVPPFSPPWHVRSSKAEQWWQSQKRFHAHERRPEEAGKAIASGHKSVRVCFEAGRWSPSTRLERVRISLHTVHRSSIPVERGHGEAGGERGACSGCATVGIFSSCTSARFNAMAAVVTCFYSAYRSGGGVGLMSITGRLWRVRKEDGPRCPGGHDGGESGKWMDGPSRVHTDGRRTCLLVSRTCQVGS